MDDDVITAVHKWKLLPEPLGLEDVDNMLYHRMELCSSLGGLSPERVPQRYTSSSVSLEAVSSMCFSPDGRLLAVGNGVGDLSLLDPTRQKTWRIMPKAVGDSASITSLIFTGERKLLASDDKGKFTLFDTRSMKEALNIVQTQSEHIHSTIHSSKSNWVITTDLSGHVVWHSLPALEIRGAELERDLHFGSLLHCPLLSQLCISGDENKMALTCRNNGSIYLIDNLNLMTFVNDIRSIRFDDSLKMYLMMSPSSGLKRNNICIMDQDEFTPERFQSVTKFSQLRFLSYDSSSLLVKMTTKEPSLLDMLNKDWMAFVKTKERNNGLYRSIGSSNAFDDLLQIAFEEGRFSTLRDKKADINGSCNLVASPHKDGVQLLSFSRRLQSLGEVVGKKSPSDNVMDMFLPQQCCVNKMNSLKVMPGARGHTFYCHFSPIFNTLLAVGDSKGFTSFYQPKL